MRKAFFSKGVVFRWGLRIKELGERIGSGWLVSLGSKIKDSVSRCPVKEM